MLEELLNFFNVSNLSELANKMNTSPQNISKWKQRNSVSAIKKKCRELGIYNEIFGNVQRNDFTDASLSSSVGVNNGDSEINLNNQGKHYIVPEYILDDLNSLFKRCSRNQNELIDAIDNFLFEQRKKCR